MSASTRYRLLVEYALGMDDICTYVRRRDDEGASRRLIAKELSDQLTAKLGRETDVSDASLNRWCPRAQPGAPSTGSPNTHPPAAASR